MNQLLKNMNERQKEAIMTTEGPLLVMAGAGSGKTRVLTHRIAYLIEEKGIYPFNILAITFTNKAAREMRDRLENLIGTRALDMWVSTFHAMCVRILRREAEYLGYTKQFSIIDTSEQQTLMKRIIKQLNFNEKQYSYKMILSVISDAKNKGITAKQFKENASHYIEDIVADCYLEYEKQLFKNQGLDFDDLILKTVQLFKKYPDILLHYQQKFKYIHVDEYQDTNKMQYELVALLSQHYHNICVVGDADQSIYGWRGADMDNILNFEKDFTKAKTILLEQNYRSTQVILNAANDVIQNNINRIEKKLWTNNNVGEKIEQYVAFDEKDEASFVANKIKELTKEKYSYDDIAVLYRTNAQSRQIEEGLMKYTVPYKIVGGLKFYDRLEIKDILAYFKIIANSDDDLSFERVVNVPKRSVGKTSLDKLRFFAQQQNISLFQASKRLAEIELTTKAKKGIEQFVALIEELQKFSELEMTTLLNLILEKTGYIIDLQKDNSIEAMARIENIEEFKSVTKVFDDSYEAYDDIPKLVTFLSDFTLDNTQEENSNHAVTLMTLHAAKGLEFKVVFIVGLEEQIFPSSRSIKEDDVEEERRLMYVGITRAREILFLTNTQSRLLYGERLKSRASRFLDEIGESYYKERKKESSVFNRQNTVNMSAFTQKSLKNIKSDQHIDKSFVIGDKVEHNKWGVGMVVKVTGIGKDKTIDVAFSGIGIKTLLAEFAPIRKLK